MVDTSWFLTWQVDQWRVDRGLQRSPEFHDLTVTATDPDEIAEQVAMQLHQLGYAGQDIVLGLPADVCLTAKVATDRRKQRDRDALLFALEEKLPIAAEQMVADFVFAKDADNAQGVAAEVSELLPLIDALEQQGVSISALCPTALLALQGLLNGHQIAARTIVLWQGVPGIHFFALDDGKLTNWCALAAGREPLSRQLRIAALASPTPMDVLACGVDQELLQYAVEETDVHVKFSDHRLDDLATEQARRVASGQQTAWVNLRRDALAAGDPFRSVRGLITAMTVAAIVFLVATSLTVHWRAHRQRNLTDAYESSQRQLFEQAFPGQRVPVGIRSRLESEYAKLAGAAGQAAELPVMVSALETLRQLLGALPSDVRFRWDRIRLDSPGQILLEGQVLSHADAGQITAALTEGGFEIEAPHTEKLPNELVAVRIRGGMPQAE